MAYKVYRHVRVQRIYSETVERIRRPQEIADPARSRGNYTAISAAFSGVPFDPTIADFKDILQEGNEVSIAVDEANNNLVAVVNHSTGRQGALKYAVSGLKDLWGTVFFLAVPLSVLGGIAYKTRNSVSYPNAKYICLALAFIITILVIRGVNKYYLDSKKALRELLAQG